MHWQLAGSDRMAYVWLLLSQQLWHGMEKHACMLLSWSDYMVHSKKGSALACFWQGFLSRTSVVRCAQSFLTIDRPWAGEGMGGRMGWVLHDAC
jgi:hypothetical protein